MTTQTFLKDGMPSQEKQSTPKVSRQPVSVVSLLMDSGAINREQLDYAERIRSKLSGRSSMIQVLKEMEYVSDEQVAEQVRQNLGNIRIGDLLVDLGLITSDELQVGLILQAAETPRRKIGEVLVDQHLIDENRFVEALSLQLDYPMVDPEFMDIDRRLFRQVPAATHRTHNFVPVSQKDGTVTVAFSDPLDAGDIQEARQVFGSNIRCAIALKKSIHHALRKYRPDLEIEGDDNNFRPSDSVSDTVNELIIAAVSAGNVSDIHIEPMPDRLRVRFRKDGVLHRFRDFPAEMIPGITSRIKVLCSADITEKRRHQGGRILFEHKDTTIDLRVSFYVTVNGEKIVLRLLNRKGELLSIEDIGMASRMLERFRDEALDCPSGVVLITGPTGSGKTTTVYSCINYLNNPSTSIITAEEPVEYVIDGIAQCSINPKINLTFEETLRHIVRQDPDVIVIGEIRDEYSAGIAVQAALTGHKVLTTFHTEDSIGGLIRLLNMDIDAFLISSTVVCVVAQRLLRQICPHCRAVYEPMPRDLVRLGYGPKDIGDAVFYHGIGCPACDHNGFKGRIGVHELLVLNEMVRDSLIARKTSHQIRQISVQSTGLVTLMEDGIAKAASGLTTISEVLRCLPRLQKPRPLEVLRHLTG